MSLPLHLIDAYAAAPFSGNPAGVCLLDGPRPDAWMQQVAREMQQAETAFLLREGADFRLRWFTPSVEVDLCGHATLASAHFLWTEGQVQPEDAVRFHTRSGPLIASRSGELIVLDFPATPAQPAQSPPGLLAALGVSGPAEVLRSRFDYLVVLEDPAALRALAPDFRELAALATRGVIVTAPSDLPEADFLSRFFAPAVGVNEDPVTGSAHCALAPYWTGRLGRAELIGYQASARGGVVRVEQAGERVRLAGRAVTVLRGVLSDFPGSPPPAGPR